MWGATLANLSAGKLRFASTAFAIVLGVAFVAGTLVLGDTLDAAFSDVFGADAAADLRVEPVEEFAGGLGATQETVPDGVVDALARVDGVGAVDPAYSGTAQLVGADGRLIGPPGAPAVGVGAPAVPQRSALTLTEGRYPEGPNEVAVDAATAQRETLALGDRLLVAVNGPARDVTVVGLFDPLSAGSLGATVTMLDPDSARQGFGEALTVGLVLEDGTDGEAVRRRVAEVLGADYAVVTGEEAAQADADAFGQILGFLTTALLVFAGVALLVACFLIFNTFSITLAQRTRELALLRAIGASRRQVLGSVLGEALLLGVLGAVAGLGAGIGVAFALSGLLGAFGFDLPTTDLVVTGRTVVVALVVGPVATLVSALAPARRATRVAPVAALRPLATVEPARGPLRLGLGGLLLAAGAGGLALGLSTGAGLPAVGAGAVAVLLGVAALSPLIAGPLARVIGAPLAATRGVPGAIARENAVRNPRRTASTAAALMIGLGLVTFVLIFAASLRSSLDARIDERFAAEFSLAPSSALAGVPAEASDAAAQVDGVAAVSRSATATAGVEGVARTVTGIEPATYGRGVVVDVTSGDLAALDGGGGIALVDTLAGELGLRLGEPVRVAFVDPREEAELALVATFADGGSLDFTNAAAGYVELGQLRAALPDLPFAASSILLEEGVDAAAVRAPLEAAVAAYPSVRLSDADTLRDQVRAQTNQLLGLVFVLLLLSVLVALFGVANTLGLSVLERTRELGLLRAVGMSRAQTRAMVRWESVIIVLLGAGLGLAVGVGYGWIFTRALAGSGLDRFTVPPAQLALAVTVAALAGTLAAVLPARRAARTNLLTALAAP